MEPVEPWDGAEGLARPAHDAVASGSGSGSGSEVEEEGVNPPVAATTAANGATITSSTAVVAVPDRPPRSLLRELIAGPGRRPAGAGARQVEGREEEQQIRQDVRLFMARLRNILPFLVLFVLKYAYTHATEIAFFACYTLLLHKLNQELRAQIALRHDADRKVLTSIVVSSLAAVGAALLLDQLAHITTHHPLFLSFASVGDAAGLDAAAAAAAATPTTAAVDAAGSEASAAFDTVAGADAAATAAAGAADDAGLEGLDLAGGMMTGGLSIEDMFWQILAADVCVRLFFTALKAMVALVPWPLLAWRPTGLALLSPRLSVPLSRWWLSSMFGKGSSHGKKPAHHYHHQVHPSMSGRASADMEGLLAEVEMASSSGSGSGSGSGSHHGARTHSPARSLGSSSSQQARRVQVSRCDRTSVYTRKRRIYTLLEAISLVVRSVLPIPAWFAYYAADKAYGDVFVWMYLTFKCMVISRHSTNLLAALKLAVTSTLEFGRVATKEEIQEAGAGDCSICYESLLDAERAVILNCSHVFCEACSSEWLDRARSCPTCPTCRATVAPNFVEGWMRSRSGSTSALPCIL